MRWGYLGGLLYVMVPPFALGVTLYGYVVTPQEKPKCLQSLVSQRS
jgi:hypothetical protein